MPAPSQPQIGVYRPPGRPGVDQALVEATANRLLEQGERPTVNRVRQLIGGSPNTIGPMLDAWWRRLGQRLHSKTPSALDRLPGQLGLIAEAFFVEALEQARIRANAEMSRERANLDQRQQDTEVRSHLLSLREKELGALVESHSRRVKELEAEIRSHVTYERKLHDAKDALERRVQDLLQQLANRPQTPSRLRKAKVGRIRRKPPAKKNAKPNQRPARKATKRKSRAVSQARASRSTTQRRRARNHR